MGKIQDSTINPGKKTKIRELIDNFGLPRLIIAGFLLALFILAPIVGADLPTQITNTINRFSWVFWVRPCPFSLALPDLSAFSWLF